MTTKAEMDLLFRNFPVAEVLAENLRIRMTPGDTRIPAWHPGYFRDTLEKELPEEYQYLVKKSDFWDFSFVEELQNSPDMLTVDPTHYPALLKSFGNERLFVVPVSLFRSVTATTALNANALRELADILVKAGHEVWFPVPDLVAPDDIAKRNALREALLEMARRKPKVFTESAITALHVAGYDPTEIATKTKIFALLEELLEHE